MKIGDCFIERIGPNYDNKSIQYNVHRIESIDSENATCNVDSMFVSYDPDEEYYEADSDYGINQPVGEYESLHPVTSDLYDEVYRMWEEEVDDRSIYYYLEAIANDLLPETELEIPTDEEASTLLKKLGYDAAKNLYEVMCDRWEDTEYRNDFPECFLPDGTPDPKELYKILNSDFDECILEDIKDEHPEVYYPHEDDIDFLGDNFFEGVKEYLKEKN